MSVVATCFRKVRNYLINRITTRQKLIYIVHSMPRSGTSSTGKALRLLVGGHRHIWQPELAERYADAIQQCNQLIEPYEYVREIPEAIKKRVTQLLGSIVYEVRGFSIFDDFPIGHVHINLRVKQILFPEARFIWIERDLDAWVASYQKWELSHPSVYPNAVSDWSNYDEKYASLKYWYGNERKKAAWFKQEFPDKMLIHTLDGEWHALCGFVNCKVPGRPYPHINRSLV